MAKFAVVFLAALAFQASSAAVHNRLKYQETVSGDSEYGLQYYGYPTGKFDALFGQLQSVSQDLNVYLQKVLPDDRLVVKTLIWQSRELVQYIDTIIERLQVEAQQYSGKSNTFFESFINELREIRVQYQKIAAYTSNIYAIDQLKNQFYTVVQRTVTQLEKLVRYVQTDYKESKGEIYVVVKNLVSDFLYAFQNIYSHVQYYGTYGEQSPKQLVVQIEEVTKSLIGYLQNFDAQNYYAVREYVQYIEAIINRLEKVEGTYGNIEVDTIFQQVYGNLRRVVQLIESEYVAQNVEVVRIQFAQELQNVAQIFEQFISYAKAGDYQSFFFEILGDYLYAIQQLRIQLQSGYQGAYQGQYYGKNGQSYGYGYGQDYGKYGQGYGKYGQGYGKYAQQYGYGKNGQAYGAYGQQYGYGKYGQGSGKYGSGYQGAVNDKSSYQVGVYGKSGYQNYYNYGPSYDQASYNYDRPSYQGLYKYGGLYDKTGYGYYAKYQGYANYDLQQYANQIQAIIRDLYQTFEAIPFDDVSVRQTVAQVIRQYAQQVEYIIERLYATENNAYAYQQIAENLRQYLLGLEQAYSNNQIYLYVQKISAEFEKLLEQPNGAYVREIVIQYLRVTYDLYLHFQNYAEISQYGYGPYARQYYGDYYGAQAYETPRELANQIQYISQDLYAIFQNVRYYNQQEASVQVRQFAQIIAYVVERLERYENINPVFQQVIFRLREVQRSLQQLLTYNVFINVNQLSEEFYQYIQVAVSEIERLIYVGQDEYYYAIKDIYKYFLYGLRDLHYQIQEVAQYGEYAQGYGYGKYGQGYGYGQEYGYGPGYGKYGQQYGQGYGNYAQQYGYGNNGQYYGQQYGYGKYGQGSGKYAQEYGYGNNGQYYGQQYGYGKYGQGYGYGQEYGYGQDYGKYGQQYGYNKYGQGSDKYAQQYGYGKNGQDYGTYGQQYGYGKYGQSSGKYAQQYGYAKNGQDYGQQYGYGKYGQGSGKYGQGYAKYDQVDAKYGKQSGSGKYNQAYGSGKYGNDKYGQSYGYGKGYEKSSHGAAPVAHYNGEYQSDYGYQQRVPYYGDYVGYGQYYASRGY